MMPQWLKQQIGLYTGERRDDLPQKWEDRPSCECGRLWLACAVLLAGVAAVLWG